jgi:hypothetical protein
MVDVELKGSSKPSVLTAPKDGWERDGGVVGQAAVVPPLAMPLVGQYHRLIVAGSCGSVVLHALKPVLDEMLLEGSA